MAANCRFAFAVHTLAVLACEHGRDVPSRMLAGSVNTNPVIIRRLLADLRHAGLVSTHQGKDGGARLTRPPGEITLAEVYQAVEECRTFSAHPHRPSEGCQVGRKIEAVLHEIFAAAQSALEAELARRTLADVVETMEEPARPIPRRNPRPRLRPRPDRLSLSES